MKKTIIIGFAVVLGAVAIAYAASTYKYKCNKCGLIQEYSSPQASLKCPNDGRYMQAAN